jgi:hypothetical protein
VSADLSALSDVLGQLLLVQTSFVKIKGSVFCGAVGLYCQKQTNNQTNKQTNKQTNNKTTNKEKIKDEIDVIVLKI